MRLKYLAGAVALASLATSPVLAAGAVNPAAGLSLAPSVRASAPSHRGSHLAGPALFAAVGAVAIGAAAIILAATDNNDHAKSP